MDGLSFLHDLETINDSWEKRVFPEFCGEVVYVLFLPRPFIIVLGHKIYHRGVVITIRSFMIIWKLSFVIATAAKFQ